jgi:hypothetical protein
MAQAVSRGLPTSLARVRFEANLRGVCSGQCCTGTGFPAGALAYPRYSYSTIALLQYYIHLQLTLCCLITESVIK